MNDIRKEFQQSVFLAFLFSMFFYVFRIFPPIDSYLFSMVSVSGLFLLLLWVVK